MPQNSFRNIGLRRDKNFSDLENRETGLTNLLNNFASGTETYVADDLTQAINGLRSYVVTQQEINSLAGITFKNTVYDATNDVAVTTEAVPLVTIKNQFDRIKLELGEESYFGGNIEGIKAKFYNESQISTSAEVTLDKDNIVSGDPVDEKPFWLSGDFDFRNKINSKLDNHRGLVQWDGFIMPTVPGKPLFFIESSGKTLLYIGGSVYGHLGENVPGSIPITYNSATNNFVLDKTYEKYVWTNMVLHTPSAGDVTTRRITGYALDSTGQFINIFTDGDYDDSANYIPSVMSCTLHTDYVKIPDSNPANPGFIYELSPPDSRRDEGLQYGIGLNKFTKQISPYNAVEFEPIPFNVSWWINGSFPFSIKQFEILISQAIGSSINAFHNVISEVPSSDPADFPEFKTFYANRLRVGGGEIGNSVDNQSIVSTGTITSVDYIPPNFYEIYKGGNFLTAESGLNEIFINTRTIIDLPPPVTQDNLISSNAEVGNYIFNDHPGDVANDPDIQIETVLPGQALLVSKAFAITSSNPPPWYARLSTIDHRGYVGRSRYSSDGTDIITLDIPDLNIIPGMMFIANPVGYTQSDSLVIGTEYAILRANTADFTSCGATNNRDGTVFTATGSSASTNDGEVVPTASLIYSEIKRIIGSDQIQISDNMPVTSQGSSKDRNAQGFIYQAAGVNNYTSYKVISVPDLTSIVLDTVVGIQPGYYIKSIGKEGTYHNQVIQSVDSNTNTITLDINLPNNLGVPFLATDDIMVTERANVDTAPPFVATLDGLSSDGASIKLTNVNGVVRALDIEVKSFAVDDDTEFVVNYTDPKYRRLIDITINNAESGTDGVAYKIIGDSFSGNL